MKARTKGALGWLFRFFGESERVVARPKFVEGTEWLCQRCGTTLGVAERDIYPGEPLRVSDWGARVPFRHCSTLTVRASEFTGRHEIYTPTGWVG